MKQIRQGDILLIAVAGIMPPKEIQPKTQVILALGELTGHAHRLAATGVYEWEADGYRYVRVHGIEPGTLAHEDHDPVPVAVVAPETTYRVIQQQVWDLSGQWRNVQD